MINYYEVLVYAATIFGLYISTFYLLTYIESPKKPTFKKMKKLQKVSILIPAYNEEKHISSTIEHVLKLTYPKKEIVVINDGSTDNTYKEAKKTTKFGVKVFTKKNEGKSSAINYGIPKCSGDLIMILDADSFPEKDCLKKMLPYFQDPSVMAVNPTLKVWKPRNLIEKLQDVEYGISGFIKNTMSLARILSMVPGAPIIRKSFLEKYGGFDTDNITEDFEMGLKIQHKGFDVKHAPDAYVYTTVPRKLSELMRQRMRWDYGIFWNLKKFGFMLGTKYGDVGVFLLPSLIVSSMFSLLFAIFWPILNLITLKKLITNLYLINFDFSYIFSLRGIDLANFTFKAVYVLTTLSIIVGGIIYLLSRKSIKEKPRLEYILFILFYGWILSVFRVLALFRFLINKKPKW